MLDKRGADGRVAGLLNHCIDTKLLESNVTQLNIRSPDAEKMK
jgi:hypothetical protein